MHFLYACLIAALSTLFLVQSETVTELIPVYCYPRHKSGSDCYCEGERVCTDAVTVTVTATVHSTSTTSDATTTISGPSLALAPNFDFSKLLDTYKNVLHLGKIGKFLDWHRNPNKNVGTCGLPTDSEDKSYWIAVTRKYIIEDPAVFPNPNEHPLCHRTFCVKVFGPNATMIFRIYDSFSSPKSEEDVNVSTSSFSELGFIGSLSGAKWVFVKCPQKLGVV